MSTTDQPIYVVRLTDREDFVFVCDLGAEYTKTGENGIPCFHTRSDAEEYRSLILSKGLFYPDQLEVQEVKPKQWQKFSPYIRTVENPTFGDLHPGCIAVQRDGDRRKVVEAIACPDDLKEGYYGIVVLEGLEAFSVTEDLKYDVSSEEQSCFDIVSLIVTLPATTIMGQSTEVEYAVARRNPKSGVSYLLEPTGYHSLVNSDGSLGSNVDQVPVFSSPTEAYPLALKMVESGVPASEVLIVEVIREIRIQPHTLIKP